MSFPRYPRYKDSGVEWLGEVPEHWAITRIKNLFELMKRAPVEGDEIVTAFRDGEVTLRSNRRVDGFTNAVHEHGYQRVLAGDLVIHAMDAFAGAVGVSDSAGKSTPVYSVCRAKDNSVDPHYYARLLRHMALSGYINALAKGVRERSTEFRWSEAANVQVPVPPTAEQNNITEFLDEETAKIDALIAEQQRLIELLKEKRQAVISSAVIPRVDERTTKLRHVIEVTPGFAFPSEGFSEYGEGHRLLRGVNVGVGACRWDETVYWAQGVDARINEYQLKVGDLVLGMDRPWINEGTRIARIESSDLPALLVQRVARIRAKAGSSLEYIQIVLASQAFQSYLEADLTGVSVPHISERQIVSFPIRALSFEDQVRIAATTMSSMSGIDNLIADSQRAIALLQERRTALISAAVTGKIDVRGIAMAEAA